MSVLASAFMLIKSSSFFNRTYLHQTAAASGAISASSCTSCTSSSVGSFAPSHVKEKSGIGIDIGRGRGRLEAEAEEEYIAGREGARREEAARRQQQQQRNVGLLPTMRRRGQLV
jgi:hypothetical protein